MNRIHIFLGFSLIEVILALGIFAMAVTVLSQATFNGLLSLESLQNTHPEVQDLRFIREQVLTNLQKDQLTSQGEIDAPYAGTAQWSMQMNTMDIIDCYQGILHIDFAQVPPNNEPAHYDLDFIIYRPDWMSKTQSNALLEAARSSYAAQVQQSNAGFSTTK